MIVGITGAVCSGKSTLALYLVKTYGFEAVNVMEIFKQRLRQLRAEKSLASALKLKEEQSSASKGTAPKEESKDGDDFIDDKTDEELGISEGHDTFCFAYYMVKFRELRMAIIKEVFRELTGKWDRHFVLYPLSASEDIQLML